MPDDCLTKIGISTETLYLVALASLVMLVVNGILILILLASSIGDARKE